MTSSINKLPDNVLELVFTHVNLYNDWNNARLVSRRWRRLMTGVLSRIKQIYNRCSTFSWKLVDETLYHNHLLSERCSHSVCYNPNDYAMYLFGGCTNKYTSFNDLWLFDMSTREWDRILIARPPLPSAKALASLVIYSDNLILFGGFSKSSMNPIHQTSTFYNELHLFNKQLNCWEEIISVNTAPHLAGHTSSVVDDFMLVFGGSMGSSYNNNVYVFDIIRRIWNMPSIPGPCPSPRYGHSQILLDKNHLVIIGGCGGPSVMFNDVWLLEFDLYGNIDWKWTQLKVENLENTPPYTWCHKAAKVGTNAVVVSRPTKFSIKRVPRRRRTSSQSTRQLSPDYGQDRRAVAAAFCNSSLTHTNTRITSGTVRVETGTLSRRRPLLTTRSLDEKTGQVSPQHNAIKANNIEHQKQPASEEQSTNPTISNTSNLSLLQRTCSIPAIIVGEIPKLVITPTLEAPPQPPVSNDDQKLELYDASHSSSSSSEHTNTSSLSTEKSTNELLLPNEVKIGGNEQSQSKDNHTNSNGESIISGCEWNSNYTPLFCTSSAGTSSDRLSESESLSSENCEALREFYISLIQDEYSRLKIVELSENLIDIDERLKKFLSDKVLYLSKQEIDGMVAEFLSKQPSNDDYYGYWRPSSRADSGQLSRRSSSSLRESIGHGKYINDGIESGGEQSIGESNSYKSEPNSSIYGQSYARRMCVYVLRLSRAISDHIVRWQQLPVEEDAPEDIMMHSLISARGELIIFGGMRSDSSGNNGMDCLGMDRHTMSSDTWILSPRYNELI